MKHKLKRSLWTYDETLEMLYIMMDQESLKAMNGRPFRKEKAFRLIQEELARRGYHNRDAKQIEYRWKNIKKRYVDIQKNPDAEQNAPFQYYDEIDLMLNGNGSSGRRNPRVSAGIVEKRNEVHSNVELEANDESTNQSSANEDPQNVSVDFCEDVAMEEEVVEEPPETSNTIQRRSQRTTKGKTRRYNSVSQRPAPLTPSATEDEAYRSQKKLLDYQFGLYSQLQRESDEKFLQMSRDILMECNTRFETFVTEVLADSDLT